MKSFLWLLVGVAAGVVLARQLEKTDQGRQFFSEIDQKARDFSSAVSDGYRKREAELRAAIDGK